MKRLTASAIFGYAIIHSLAIHGQAPSNVVATPVSTSIGRYEKFETTITLVAGYSNPYDYDDLSITGIFTAPSGKKDTVDAFFMQDYSLNMGNGSIAPTGPGGFRLRYTPTETGSWQYLVLAKNPLGTASSAEQSFQCTASSSKGFVRKNTTNYLAFDNGSQYIPVGQNQAWHQSNPYLDYKNWLQKLSDNKANTIRVWQAVWGFGIEWKNGTDGYAGLKKYKQTSAYYTDLLFEEAKARGIYIMLCINHHGMVSSNVNPNWPESPYNAANGGPCANTWDFFTNATARQLHKNRLRYIVARWGYSPNLMSWELFNEVDWTDDFSAHKNEVKDWHVEMANYLKQVDAWKHLVTTSYANNIFDPNTWNSPAIDITQVHNYIGSPNVESALAGAVSDYVSQYNKPALNGEFGIDAGNISLSTIDPNGIYLHNSVWATSFSGAMGAGMSWWWDNYIEPRNLYVHYKPLGELLATIPLKDGNYKKTASSVTGGGAGELSLTPGVGFGSAGASSFTIDASGAISPSAAQLSSFLFGSVYNTQYRMSPSFLVTYPVDGQFKVSTGASAGTSPKVNIYLDGVQLLSQDATVNTIYSINVPAGSHTIKVDNLGTDWVSISAYTFTNVGSALNTYVLKSADSKQMAAWVHNKRYNWQYVRSSGVPAAVNGASLIVPNMENGSYQVRFTDCSTGALVSTINAVAFNNNLGIPLPAIGWDLAVTAVWGGVTPVNDLANRGSLKIFPNPLAKEKLAIRYDLGSASRVSIEIFDLRGNKLASVFNGLQPAGDKLIEWDPASAFITPGVYLVRFSAGKQTINKKLVIFR